MCWLLFTLLDKKQLWGTFCHFMESLWQECKTACHMTATLEEQRGKSPGPQFSFPVFVFTLRS